MAEKSSVSFTKVRRNSNEVQEMSKLYLYFGFNPRLIKLSPFMAAPIGVLNSCAETANITRLYCFMSFSC